MAKLIVNYDDDFKKLGNLIVTGLLQQKLQKIVIQHAPVTSKKYARILIQQIYFCKLALSYFVKEFIEDLRTCKNHLSVLTRHVQKLEYIFF